MSETDLRKLRDASKKSLCEMVCTRVTVLGRYSLQQMRLSCEEFWPSVVDDLQFKLETEILCQSRGNLQQTVQFWVPASWWQHLKRTIVHRWFERVFVEGEEFSYQTKGWGFRRWIGQRINFKLKAVDRTVEWEVLDSYPMADVEVPEDFGKPVRIVIPQAR